MIKFHLTAVSDTNERGKLAADSLEMRGVADFLKGSRQPIAPIFTAGGARMVEALIQAEKLGNHQGCVAGI